MDFTRYICPVCEQSFKDDDDVVVCPECGTPHHRECWKKENKCFNDAKHETDEKIEILTVHSEDDDTTADNTATSQTETPLFGKRIQNPKTKADFAVNELIKEFADCDSDKDVRIDGLSTADFAAALKKNQMYYIPRFMIISKAKNAVSWNSSAFFFPLAWSVYRKMYKFVAVILAVYMLMFVSVSFSILGNEELMTAVTVCAEEDPYFMQSIIDYNSQDTNVSLTAAQSELNNLIQNYSTPVWQSLLFYGIGFVIRLLMGFFATNLYYNKLSKNIRQIRTIPIKEEYMHTYLTRKYGTAPMFLALIAGFFELQLFFTI